MNIPVLPAFVTLTAALAYQGSMFAVAIARSHHKVKAPATNGPEEFERVLRIQQNTLEQMMFFLPVFWLAALSSNTSAASLIGFIWIGARIAYGVGYWKDAKLRAPGFGISLLASALLLVMAVFGLLN
ncbi:MAG: MAPEG family protein [Prochlorococcus sp.]|jgi:glutathione S-transferase|nr:MAPEG family protein [Prochlorococcaceae cyanobacterium ETNP2_MAG_10]MDP6196614.1 MAPEG family protein [Prochlorococcaceae cyanobacterium ETNP18_MAG_17]MDP6321752.1 MAPEG family protein [Prochlorococcaceae cyanobacterium ETNP14_MAG_5]|tara:strand:- start:1095 stop:1478 length:384 start_codon:yes stop_codon:yes gene_type:complete